MKELFLTILQGLKFWQWMTTKKEIDEAVEVEDNFKRDDDRATKLLSQDDN